MSSLVYAGIGSRSTNPEICSLMTKIAIYLREKNYWLRTGAADGADLAFTKGAEDRNISYLPWIDYNIRNRAGYYLVGQLGCNEPTQAAINLAGNYHPAWQNCKDSVRKMHGRNMHIISGINLDSPVRFVICYAEYNANGTDWVGGTGQALRYAKSLNIPILNLYDVAKYYSAGDPQFNKVLEFINAQGQ